MDVTDLCETIQTWLSIYNENPNKDEAQDKKNEEQTKWELNMLRISETFRIPETLHDTPARAHIEKIVMLSKTKDASKLPEIASLCSEIDAYLR